MGHSPAGAEVAVCVRKGGAVLAEVAVEGRGEALEADAEESVQCLEDVHRQRALQACALVETHAEHHLRSGWLSLGRPPRPPGQPAPSCPGQYLVPAEQTPDPGQESLKGGVVDAAVAVKEPLWGRKQWASTAARPLPPPQQIPAERGPAPRALLEPPPAVALTSLLK